MFGSVAFRLLSIAVRARSVFEGNSARPCSSQWRSNTQGMTDDEELRNERLLWRKYKVSLKV